MEKAETRRHSEANEASGSVLLVDDQDELRRAFARGLRSRGHVVTEAANGRSAAELMNTQRFDVVVSDIRMPDLDGIGLLRLVHEKDPDLPVLLMSGVPDLDSAMQALEFGALEYLKKPIDFEKLQSSVQRAISARRDRLEAKQALEQFRSSERARPSTGPGETWTGALLGGRYRIGALIGEGGMGSVYDAVREDLGQMRVAIKILHGGVVARADLLARFRREAEMVASIDHPNIVRIVDFQTPEGEPPFLVMERLYGSCLLDTLAKDGRFDEARIAFVATQMLGALAAAHKANVIHRDLKPENVFLTSVSGMPDIVKLLDFGIAKPFGSAIDQRLTQTGVVVGTPAYMAPEHARGSQVDTRSDLYAVGAVMYEALSGIPPFSAENYNALMFAIQENEPLSLGDLRPDVDPRLVAIVQKAMNKDPADRFQDAESMAEALQPWVAPLSVRPSVPSGASSDRSPMAFSPTLVVKRTQQ